VTLYFIGSDLASILGLVVVRALTFKVGFQFAVVKAKLRCANPSNPAGMAAVTSSFFKFAALSLQLLRCSSFVAAPSLSPSNQFSGPTSTPSHAPAPLPMDHGASSSRFGFLVFLPLRPAVSEQDIVFIIDRVSYLYDPSSRISGLHGWPTTRAYYTRDISLTRIR